MNAGSISGANTYHYRLVKTFLAEHKEGLRIIGRPRWLRGITLGIESPSISYGSLKRPFIINIRTFQQNKIVHGGNKKEAQRKSFRN